MNSIHPMDIFGDNVGSQDGLFEVFKWINNQYVSSKAPHIIIIVDINIYWRMLKILYNPLSVNGIFSTKICFSLGFWHTYKQLNLLTWRKYEFFFGKLYHSIFPTTKVIQKPPLIHLEQFYTWLTVAFWDDKCIFLTCIQEYKNNNTNTNIQGVFQYLELLFTFILPFVCFFSY